MTIQFNHKGEIVNAVVSNPARAANVIFLFPDSNMAELGWSILLTKTENKWTTDSNLIEKYPTTFLNILSGLKLI
ncbi:MAG TPA: hypothetical protein VH396_07590 [Chitinophagaceae bacterium]|jgi:hypothetical protein